MEGQVRAAYNDLKICHLNVRSLTSHFADFSDLFSTKDYDIIAISETWLTVNIPTHDINLNGYNFVRRDRQGLERGGGVGIYIKNTFKFNILQNTANLEDLWLGVQINGLNIAVGCVYKPPSVNNNFFLNEFESTVFNYSINFEEIICLGDFNIDFLKINNNNSLNVLCNILESAGLKQIVNVPTRITGNSFTLLDLIIINETRNYSQVGSASVDNISDHELIFAHLNFKILSGRAAPYKWRDYKNIDEDALNGHLRAIPWRNIYDLTTIEDKVSFFNDNLNTLLEIHAPVKVSNRKKMSKPWITPNIKILIKEKNKAFNKYKKYKTQQLFQDYKNIKNYLTSAVRREKKAFLRQSVEEKNQKKLWSSLRRLNVYGGMKDKSVPDQLANVNEINRFFVSSIPQAADDVNINNYYSGLHRDVTSLFSFQTVSDDVVCKYLLSIRSKAVGADGLHIDFILLCCPFLVTYICHIINFCIIKSVFPTQWKVAHIVPIPKVNNPTDYNELRPISILCVVSKVLEKILKQQIIEHVENYNLLPETQSGFRRGHSCATALLNITDKIFRAHDAGLCSLLVLLDYSKAFDTLNIETLLVILKYIGFNQNSLKLVHSFLSDRKQRVLLNNFLSNSVNVSRGVPQGSVLGPLLFTIYTSCIPKFIDNCYTQLYADDTQLLFSFNPDNYRDACNRINRDLEKIYSISLKHSLILNPKKCICVLFGRQLDRQKIQEHILITINNINIPLKNEVKNLGVIMDSSLNFEKHVTTCIKSAITKLKILYNSKDILNKQLKIKLCDSLILSVFNYADVVYGPCITAENSYRIQKIQNCCLRFIHGISKRQHISHKLSETKWANMEGRRLLHISTLYHKIIMSKKPSYLYSKITFRTDVHNINVRYKGTLTPPIHKTALFESSFTYHITKIYNSLPSFLRTCPVNSFPRLYKKHIFNF